MWFTYIKYFAIKDYNLRWFFPTKLYILVYQRVSNYLRWLIMYYIHAKV